MSCILSRCLPSSPPTFSPPSLPSLLRLNISTNHSAPFAPLPSVRLPASPATSSPAMSSPGATSSPATSSPGAKVPRFRPSTDDEEKKIRAEHHELMKKAKKEEKENLWPPFFCNDGEKYDLVIDRPPIFPPPSPPPDPVITEIMGFRVKVNKILDLLSDMNDETKNGSEAFPGDLMTVIADFRKQLRNVDRPPQETPVIILQYLPILKDQLEKVIPERPQMPAADVEILSNLVKNCSIIMEEVKLLWNLMIEIQ